MWKFDLIKRNNCLITIGKTQRSGLTMMTEESAKATPPKPDPNANTADPAPPPQPVFESPDYQAGEVRVPCYFLSVPKFSFQSTFSEQNDLLEKIMGPAAAGMHAANMALPALMDVNNNLDTLMDAGGALHSTIVQNDAQAIAGGQDKNTLRANKMAAAMGALNKVGQVFGNAASQETRTMRAGNVVSWQGSSPIEFQLEVLFCKPNDGVHMGVLYPLIEASGFSELVFGNFMYGPRGFNSAGFGIGAMKKILNGEYPSLHSLKLWHSAREDFVQPPEATKSTILELFRLLVITNVQIDRAEQLFFNPAYVAETAPLYKWIKATITFKTACPIPGALWQVSDTGTRPNGRSNASLHDFYGSVDAPYDVNYANPIGTVVPPKGSDTAQGWADMTRMTGLEKEKQVPIQEEPNNPNKLKFGEANVQGTW